MALQQDISKRVSFWTTDHPALGIEKLRTGHWGQSAWTKWGSSA